LRRLAFIGFFLAAGCTNNFDPAQHLDGLRMLGLVATPPSVASGQSTTLAPILIDTKGETATIDWDACLAMPGPGDARTNLDCVQNDTAPYLIPLGSGPTLSATLPPLRRAQFGDIDGTGGVYLPVRMKVQTASDSLTAIYHLRIDFGGVQNNDPKLAGWYLNEGSGTPLIEDMPMDVHGGDKLIMHASFQDGSAESYSFVDDAGATQNKTEVLIVDWFGTAGTFSADQSGPDIDVTWTADKYLPGAGSVIDLYVVGRDGRGGMDYLHRTLRMQ
jgi:hypothetical protein